MGEFHCLNVGCADTSVIIDGANTFLVDCYNISEHSALLPKSKRIRAVFITHQHRDHYLGLQYLKDNGYSLDYIIFSPYDRRRGDNSITLEEWNEFNSLKDHFVTNGTETRTPYRQDDFNKPWWDCGNVRFEIIGPHKDIATSATREIHDASLVLKAYMGDRVCLFTGDASDTCLNKIAETTTNFCGDILHASHHGSINGADLDFIKKCNAQHTVISTSSGVHDNVPHATALSRYRNNTTNVRRTDVDGTWKWTF